MLSPHCMARRDHDTIPRNSTRPERDAPVRAIDLPRDRSDFSRVLMTRDEIKTGGRVSMTTARSTPSNFSNGQPAEDRALKKSPTGIVGLDEVTGGGLSEGRTMLVCGSPGCGETLFGTKFLADSGRLNSHDIALSNRVHDFPLTHRGVCSGAGTHRPVRQRMAGNRQAGAMQPTARVARSTGQGQTP